MRGSPRAPNLARHASVPPLGSLVRWLGIVGVLLLISGLLTPLFGPMFGRNFGEISLGLTLVGLVLFALSALQRPRSSANVAPDGTYGDATGAEVQDGHDSHIGGHGGEGDH
jgi:hypothetical protein